MAENQASSSEAPAGMPYYEKLRAHLKELLNKRRHLERSLNAQEEAIQQKEQEYLDSTPTGNIITGFDGYIKGATGAAAQRRKTGLAETNRVFSRSSVSFSNDVATPGSSHSTPASHAPTPISTAFARDGASNHGTPTSATAPRSAVGKKNKKASEDSETDTKEVKKARTNFGAVRK